ncbi:hypothetical protein KFL_000200670 [Klebsormidium nitens]|uniref:Glycosyltransferase 2-like domain-containing protein n=1 Tax=Klebsormidium nitens TaxID=105231 RepID=A0A1Y1HK29_KLENI|nr:hypothetical protein KFL_000200670 [Klebsormidium nitens]|eukprot:GAQ78914.1 hypothetical protein KFL_000200670 [Klebsormidium nitens]
MLWQAHRWRLALSFTIIVSIELQVVGAIAKDGGAGHILHGGLLGHQSRSPKFMLFRLIGNNMPPLQSSGQLLWNTEYALKHEADFPDCRKRWIINQVVNTTEKQLILDLLKLHGYGSEDILTRELDYDELIARPEPDWEVFVTAQNQGRNAAIQNGKAAGATWILPFDGNHFITNQAWRRIVRSARWAMKAGHQYFKVPMYRVAERQDSAWLNASTTFQTALQYAPLKGESQIAIRNTAARHFPEDIRYGKRNKWNFLKEVCPSDHKDSGICGCSDVYPEKIEAESNKRVDLEPRSPLHIPMSPKV